MSDFYGKVGFASPAADNKFVKRRRHDAIELMATAALAVSLIIAVTAVSIGAARAQVLGAVAQNRDAFVALVMTGLGGVSGLTAMVARNRSADRDRL